MMIDDRAQDFGLPHSLLVPIAATDIKAIKKYVGSIKDQVTGRTGRINAMTVIPLDWPPKMESNIPLWQDANANIYMARLHPQIQVWVHVDYSHYRKAYQSFDTPEIPANYFLDHIQNREAIRLRDYSHPYLRLCPISRKVNTSGGLNSGGEGMEKEFIRKLSSYSNEIQESFREAIKCQIVYADPMDLTKILDIPPGTKNLDGVGLTQGLFFRE